MKRSKKPAKRNPTHLTKREAFALTFMAQIIQKSPYGTGSSSSPLYAEAARGALAYADALLAELKK